MSKMVSLISSVVILSFLLLSSSAFATESKFSYIDGNKVSFEYKGKPVVLDVSKSVWLKDVAYFRTSNNEIYRWGEKIAADSFGLIKYFDKVYFLTQLADGVEWYGTLLSTIEVGQSIKTVEILTKDGEKVNTENISVLNGFFVIEDSYHGICFLGEGGVVGNCHNP